MKKGFWDRVLSATDITSSKRLLTLVMAAHFILTSFLVSFFAFFTNTSVDPALLGLLDKILDSEMVVILGGLAMIGTENLGSILLARTKIKAAANIEVGSPTADDIKIDTVNVEQMVKTTKNDNSQEV